MFCTNCGKELKDGSTFCTNCGLRAETALKEEATQGQAMEKENVQARQAPTPPKTEEKPQASAAYEAGVESQHAPNTSTRVRDDPWAVARQIIGKNTDYYLTQFEQIQHGGKSKINWASFLLGLWHASYRNVWRDWLRAIRLPLIIELTVGLIAGVFFFFQPMIGVVLLFLALAADIWRIVTQILFAKRFNQIYMQHVERKVAQDNTQADPAYGRVIVAFLTGTSIGIAVYGIFAAAIFSGLLAASGDSDFRSYLEDATSVSTVQSELSKNDVKDSTLESPATSQTHPDDQMILNDYLGDWIVDRYSGDSPELVSFSISTANDQYYFGGAANWKVHIDSTLIEVTESDAESTLATAQYVDNRGNEGTITLKLINPNDIYITITVDNSSDRGMMLSYEHCSRVIDAGTSPADYLMAYPYSYYYEGHSYSSEMNSLSDYTIGDAYLWPTDTEIITDGDMNDLTNMEVAAVRNEIYARHGYIFSAPEWRDFFNTATWYSPDSAFSEDMLNTTEKQNIDIIAAYEQAHRSDQ